MRRGFDARRGDRSPGWVLPEPLPVRPGEPLSVAWLCEPGGAGSGGHTTMYRMVAALESAGHRCVVYLQDRHGWDIEQHRETIRAWWPWMKAEIRDAADGIADAHAVFATSWETAYPVLASPARGRRFYLVQDFEPAFHPAGSAAMLAESTYRFGFHGVTAGPWLAELLRRDYGMSADHFDFGRDPVYELDRSPVAAGERTGICFYRRPETPRRAFEIGVLALDLFAARHPEVEIHLFGREVKELPFRATHHGLLTPSSSTGSTTAASPASCFRPPTSRSCPTRCWRRAAFRWSTTPSTTGSCSTTRPWPTRRALPSSWPRRLPAWSRAVPPSAERLRSRRPPAWRGTPGTTPAPPWSASCAPAWRMEPRLC